MAGVLLFGVVTASGQGAAQNAAPLSERAARQRGALIASCARLV